MYIAAEPATDNFVAVLRGAQEDVIPGTALVLIIAIIIVDIIIVVIVIVIIIITRPWPAFGRQGLVGSSLEYSYTCLASRLGRSAWSEIMTF